MFSFSRAGLRGTITPRKTNLGFLIPWGGLAPHQTAPISRPPASPKSASSLPRDVGFPVGEHSFPGRPEADLGAARGRLVARLWGGGAPPGNKESQYLFSWGLYFLFLTFLHFMQPGKGNLHFWAHGAPWGLVPGVPWAL